MNLCGILKIDHNVTGDYGRMRVIFYAEPTTLLMSTQIKKVPDSESLEARWVTVKEFMDF